MRHKCAFAGASALSLSLAFLAAVPAMAQDQAGQTAGQQQAAEQAASGTDNLGMGDIVVTARRRQESLQSVPVSVAAFSAAALESKGIQSIADIQQSTPNLTFSPGTGGSSSQISPFIRGVGEYDYIITSDPAVAVFIDGVYQARAFGAITSLMGIERIEVLRGPQGSLFGKNTIGGAINIVTHRPDGSDTGSVDLRVGSYDSVQLRGLYDGRINDQWAYSVSVIGKRADGWQENLAGTGDLGNEKQVAGRVALRYRGDDLDATLSIDGLHQRQNSSAHSMIAFQPSFISDLYSAFVAPCCTVLPDNIRQTASNGDVNVDNADAVNASLTLEFGGTWGVKSITGVRYTNVEFARDGDASTLNYAGDHQWISATQLSQEIHLTRDDLLNDRGRVLLGFYGFYERAHQETRLITAEGLYEGLMASGDPMLMAMAPVLDFNVDFDLRQKNTNLAVFGNFIYELTDRLSVDAGARFTWERKKLDASAMRVFADIPLIDGHPAFGGKESWSNFSPKVTLSYEFDTDKLGYFTFSKGFRSGGFNGRPTAADEIGTYDPEKLTSLEAGLKTSWFDRRLRFNLSAYYNRYTDQQVSVSFVGSSGLVVVRTENAGKSRMWGFEAETNAYLTDWLSLDASVGYINSKYLEYMSVDTLGNPLDRSGLKLKQTPPWTGSVGVTTRFPLGNANGTFRVDASYQDSKFIDVANTDILKGKAHAILNARLEVDLNNGWALGVEGQNLTDKQVIREGYDARTSFGFTEAYYSLPRRIYGFVKYDF